MRYGMEIVIVSELFLVLKLEECAAVCRNARLAGQLLMVKRPSRVSSDRGCYANRQKEILHLLFLLGCFWALGGIDIQLAAYPTCELHHVPSFRLQGDRMSLLESRLE